MRVNISSSGAFNSISGPMISCTSPPEQKLSPAPCTSTTFTSSAWLQALEQVAQLGIRREGQRVLALGPVQRDGADAVLARATGNVRRGSRSTGGGCRPASVASMFIRKPPCCALRCEPLRTAVRGSWCSAFQCGVLQCRQLHTQPAQQIMKLVALGARRRHRAVRPPSARARWQSSRRPCGPSRSAPAGTSAGHPARHRVAPGRPFPARRSGR